MSWQNEMKNSITTIEELASFLPMDVKERTIMERIIAQYPMAITKYYLNLIDPNDPQDPIRKMAIPSATEMNLDGDFDTSGEADNTVTTGLQHKYGPTALILSTNLCAMYCRHCFRKRLVGLSNNETMTLFDQAADYIREHKEINNILISGGDAFLNSNKMIAYYLETLSTMDHLSIIRFGTRTPVVLPSRIYDDQELLDTLEKYNKIKPIYVVTQFNHPRELTQEAQKAINCLLSRGIVVSNQNVLLRGVNDMPEVLAQLMDRLTKCHVVPYYTFQCRPVSSVKSQFQVPLEQGCQIVEQAKGMMNGHGKRFRYMMSHPTGKIEILGQLPDGQMLFKYHQAKNALDQGRIFTKTLAEKQAWLDEI